MATTNNEIGERVAVIETKLDQVQNELQDIKKILSDDYTQTKKRVDALEETVAPITAFRRKIWAWIVFVVFAVGIIETLIFNYIKDNVK